MEQLANMKNTLMFSDYLWKGGGHPDIECVMYGRPIGISTLCVCHYVYLSARVYLRNRMSKITNFLCVLRVVVVRSVLLA